jgi:predicted metal-dependent HD superfamily phosphohydrolase
MQDSDAVRWAIFYHDAVYRSRRKDNEEKSAQMARREMQPMGLPEALILKVEDMILRTQHHHGEGADPDTRLMLDMDLSILGAEPARYLDYAAAVRKEYRWVPAPLYRKGRSEVLRSFLKRDRIYFSDYFHQRLEAPARENLQEELSRLS